MSRAKDRRQLDTIGGAQAAARGWRTWAAWTVCALLTGGLLLFALSKLAGNAQPHAMSAQPRAGALHRMRSSGLLRGVDALDVAGEQPAISTAQADSQTAWVADELQPVAEASEVPAPAPLAALAEKMPAAAVMTEAGMPAVAFLFLTINGEVTWPEIWADFFAGAADPRMFGVYIHRSNDDSPDVEPSPAALAFLAACRGRANSVPTAADTAWGQLIAAERSLAAGAVKTPENVVFVYVSHTTLPVKSFAEVFETLTSRNTSSFCLTTQQTWVRSRVDADAVFPKTSQWISLSRDSAERFADEQRGDAVALVNQACGGSWRQCYPATSEELVMAAITGPVPAAAMGSDWLASHPPPGGGPDNALVTALLNEAAADVDDGAAANATLEFAGVNGGGIPVRDVGATNQGLCDTWHWWDDLPSDAVREPAFEPMQLLANSVKARGDASPDTDVESILEQHVDRFWSPPWHPQELRGEGMTEEFLLEGLCASKSLFARKFSAEFTLRPAPTPRTASGDWECPIEEWKATPHEKLDGVSCDGMHHAPILGLGLNECRQLCCAMGRERCTAWQYRGRWSNYHFCWLGRTAGRCSEYGEAKAQLWRGERLLPEPEPLPQNASAVARQRVIEAFARCFQRCRSAQAPVTEPVDSFHAAQAPAPAEALEQPEDEQSVGDEVETSSSSAAEQDSGEPEISSSSSSSSADQTPQQP